MSSGKRGQIQLAKECNQKSKGSCEQNGKNTIANSKNSPKKPLIDTRILQVCDFALGNLVARKANHIAHARAFTQLQELRQSKASIGSQDDSRSPRCSSQAPEQPAQNPRALFTGMAVARS
jgi:hypothetical protein